MRITHFVLDIGNTTAVTGSQFTIDGEDPSTRTIADDFYPIKGEAHATIDGRMFVYQGSTELVGSTFTNAATTGLVRPSNIINANGAMKMTGSITTETGPGNYRWGTLMIAQSTFEG